MADLDVWPTLEVEAPFAAKTGQTPLKSLARGDIAAIICRRALEPNICQQVVATLVAEQLLYDPTEPLTERFRRDAIPENYYYREGDGLDEKQDRQRGQPRERLRIDVGTSLGTRGTDPESFFAHSAETHELFGRLFDTERDPVATIYNQLAALSPGKRVQTAQEDDGRLYGPAIFRAHYGGFSYKPHYDSVRHREKRTQFCVYEFQHQFAGVLVLQNSVKAGRVAETRIHRCFSSPEVNAHLENDTFHEYAQDESISAVDIKLEPGDLYFFNTGCIHEVPGVSGSDARIVLATFIGYSDDRPEVYVWS